MQVFISHLGILCNFKAAFAAGVDCIPFVFANDLELVCVPGDGGKMLAPLCNLNFIAFQKSIADLRPEFHSGVPITVPQAR